MPNLPPSAGNLEALYEAVRATSLPESFQQIAFQELLRAELAIPASEASVVPRGGQSAVHRDGPAPGALEMLASRIGVDASELADVYALTDPGVDLLVPAKALAVTASEATRQLAILVAAGWQGSGAEDATSFERIRETCVDYRKYDTKNFATHLAGMDDVFLIRGKGRQREVRMARPGWARAAELIRDLHQRLGD